MSTQTGETSPETAAPFDVNDSLTLEEAVDLIQEQAEKIQELEARVEALEEEDEAWEKASSQLEDVAQDLRQGKIAGEMGVTILQQLNTFSATTLTDGRALKLYYEIIRQERIGQPVPATQVITWLEIQTKNSHQTAHRVMKRLADLTQDGHLIGDVDCFLRRGKRCVMMAGEPSG